MKTENLANLVDALIQLEKTRTAVEENEGLKVVAKRLDETRSLIRRVINENTEENRNLEIAKKIAETEDLLIRYLKSFKDQLKEI